MELFSLKGQNAVVIGGNGGLGIAMVSALCEAGAAVLVGGHSAEKLEAFQTEMADKGFNVDVFPVDIAEEDSVKALFSHAVETMGRVDILVNAHGMNIKKPLFAWTTEDWDRMFQVNVRGSMLAIRTFGAHMKENGYGKIVSLSSLRGEFCCGEGNTAYCATKGALNAFTKSASQELGPEVCINAIGPSLIMTEHMKKLGPPPGVDPTYNKMHLMSKPLQRLGEPEDLKGLTVFLCSHASDFITGQILYADGGYSAVI